MRRIVIEARDLIAAERRLVLAARATPETWPALKDEVAVVARESPEMSLLQTTELFIEAAVEGWPREEWSGYAARTNGSFDSAMWRLKRALLESSRIRELLEWLERGLRSERVR